jgi:hypothetical protein
MLSGAYLKILKFEFNNYYLRYVSRTLLLDLLQKIRFLFEFLLATTSTHWKIPRSHLQLHPSNEDISSGNGSVTASSRRFECFFAAAPERGCRLSYSSRHKAIAYSV